MSQKKCHVSLCQEAVNLLVQVAATERHHTDSPPPADIQIAMAKLRFMAENIAGDAGALAAMKGRSARIPEALLSHRALAAAFSAEYAQEIDHMRFSASVERMAANR